MAEHNHSVTCPVCGTAFGADTQDEMVKLIQAHAKKEHGMDLPREKALDMEKSQAK